MCGFTYIWTYHGWVYLRQLGVLYCILYLDETSPTLHTTFNLNCFCKLAFDGGGMAKSSQHLRKNVSLTNTPEIMTPWNRYDLYSLLAANTNFRGDDDGKIS